MTNVAWDKLVELDENELRTEVIIPLLERTPGVEQITDVHGSNERGLDVIFFTVDMIRRTCYGMQIKTGSISGGGSQKETVKTIIDQLELATDFEHPVAIEPAGKYQIERFIVATSGSFSNVAQEEIASRLRPTRVSFWNLSEIVNRAQDVFPEILRVADAEIVEYCHYVKARSETLDALDQITQVANRSLSEVFVEPVLRRRFDPTLADSGGSAPPNHKHTIGGFEIEDGSRDIVILGEQNEGKTALMRMLAIRRSQSLLSGEPDLEEDYQIPVRILASSVIHSGNLFGSIAEELRNGGAETLAERVERGGSMSNLWILVDGFSELPSEEAKRECAALVENAARQGDCRITVGARPDDFLTPEFFTGFDQYTIAQFDSSQVRQLVRKWTKDAVEFGDVAEKMVRRVREALQLPGSPIPAIIGVMLYEKEQRFITNTAEAVDRYMVIRLGRYAEEMGMQMEVDWTTKQDLISEVAFAMVSEGRETVAYEDAVEVMNGVFERRGETVRTEVAIAELVQTGVLDLYDGQLSFYRTAFRDFFAAHYLNNRHGGEFNDFFKDHVFDRRWGQVLVFAAGLRRHNSDLLLELKELVETEREQLSVAEGDDYLYGAYLLGRMLSNSAPAEEAARMGVLKVSVSAARESAASLSDAAAEQFGNIGKVIGLVGTEHTLFITVGVPWLSEQLRRLSRDESLHEEERYLAASVCAHLGSEDWLHVLGQAIEEARSPKVMAALLMLVHVLDHERTFEGDDRKRWRQVREAMEEKREKFSEPVDAMLEVKDPLLRIERQRLRRLSSEN